MDLVVLDWIILLSYISLFIPAAALLLLFKRLHPALKWYTYFLLFSLITGIASNILYTTGNNPNYGGSTYYTFAPLFFHGFFFRHIKLSELKNRMFVVCTVHTIFGLANIFLIQKETINTYTGISHAFIIVFLSLIYFFRLLKDLPEENIVRLPVFWIITSEFLVNTGQMLMKSFAHFLINIFNDNLIVLWAFHYGLSIAGNIVIAYAVLLYFRNTNRSRSLSTIEQTTR